jgi:dienelactone hydrolase
VLVVLAGCGGDDEPRRPQAGAGTPTPPPAPATESVRFRASDGVRLRGRLASPRPRAPAVIVMNTSNTAGPRFDRVAAELHAAGFTTLSFTARARFNSLRDVNAENNERTVALDVAGAVRFLRRRPEADSRRIGAFAQSMGATAVLYALGTHAREGLAAAVALSPPDSEPILRLQTAGRYRPHDALLIADEGELISSENLAQGALRSEVWQAPIDGHGAELLPDARVRERIAGWFADRLR